MWRKYHRATDPKKRLAVVITQAMDRYVESSVGRQRNEDGTFSGDTEAWAISQTWYAVMRQAILDLAEPQKTGPRGKEKDREFDRDTARSFFMGGEFIAVCAMNEIDPQQLVTSLFAAGIIEEIPLGFEKPSQATTAATLAYLEAAAAIPGIDGGAGEGGKTSDVEKVQQPKPQSGGAANQALCAC